jgi:hypothetical protein
MWHGVARAPPIYSRLGEGTMNAQLAVSCSLSRSESPTINLSQVSSANIRRDICAKLSRVAFPCYSFAERTTPFTLLILAQQKQKSLMPHE